MKKIFKINCNKYIFDAETLDLYLNTKFNDKLEQNSSDKKIVSDRLSKLVFNVSNACNLNCKYCYANGGNYQRKNALMNQQTADEILKTVFNKYNSIKTVYFFGGEPLINFVLIKYIVQNINRKYTNVDFRVVTNGVFLDKIKIDFFDKHNFKIYISLDGPQNIHEFLRGKNTYRPILEALKYLKTKSIFKTTEILCTYTNYHQKNITFKDLINFFDNLEFRYSITDVITKDPKLKIKNNQSYKAREKKYINNCITRIINNSNNVGISNILSSSLDALVFQIKNPNFCKELANNYSCVYDFNNDEYSCLRLIGSYIKKSKQIKNLNCKNSNICKKCWCKNICKVCIADILLKNSNLPFKNNTCILPELYEYTFQKILELMETDEKKLESF